MKISNLLLLLFLISACTFSPQRSPEEQHQLDQVLIDGLRSGNKIRVDSSLNVGADANVRDEEGTPAIILAANSGSLGMVEKLLENDADVNLQRQDYYYSTALMEIAVRSDTAMARVLLDAGADVHIRDTFGDPALNWTAYYGHLPFFKMLIAYGADWNVESKHGTALDIAMKQWNDGIVEYLITKGAGSSLPEKASQFMEAIKTDNEAVVDKLLQEGQSPDQQDEVGSPALVVAASRGNLPIVEQLIEAGAAVNAMNRVGQTALSRAAYFGHLRICEALLEADADPNLAGKNYNLTPLISAANSGQARIGALLVKNGAQMDEQDRISGFTPLMFATAYGHNDFVKLLLDSGANPYVKSFDGASLFDLLSYSSNSAIRKMLEEYVSRQ